MTRRIREEEEKTQELLRQKSVLMPSLSKRSTKRRTNAKLREPANCRTSWTRERKKRGNGLRKTSGRRKSCESSTGS